MAEISKSSAIPADASEKLIYEAIESRQVADFSALPMANGSCPPNSCNA